MRGIAGFITLAAAALLSVGCKSIHPSVVAAAQSESCWYTYLPQRAPEFCLRTRYAYIWNDPEVPLGNWRMLHPDPPHRVVMEARGTLFALHRRYVWDGKSFGCTLPRDLMPSLRHDALYHALKEGAPIKRHLIDRAYKRDAALHGAKVPFGSYAAIRLFGGIYNDIGIKNTLIYQPVAPGTPLAPFEPNRPDPPTLD